jgi:catechol 2,3-dioxygenase-like lactoylglutathione lyase family enzyme
MALSEARVHATLPVSNLARAKEFYAERLGLKPTSETTGGAFYECAEGTRFVLFPSAGAPSGTHTQLGFAVRDIEAEVADLKASGVVFEEYAQPGFKTEGSIATTGPIRAAFLKDSEGNLIGLVQLPTT